MLAPLQDPGDPFGFGARRVTGRLHKKPFMPVAAMAAGDACGMAMIGQRIDQQFRMIIRLEGAKLDDPAAALDRTRQRMRGAGLMRV